MSSKTGGLREFGKFRLDAERRVLWFENAPVNLPLKEIELLCVLTESSGEVVTKDELLEKVWADSFVEESNLSRHIYVLRKIFKDYGEATDLIQTVPRRGYRFTGEVRQVENGNGGLVSENQALTSAADEIREGANGIAVLPFVNLTQKAGDDFFCDGLAEELLNTLAKIENLKVAARTSSFAFKNKNLGVGEIGRALNVNLVLEGSVGRVGNQLRITARLVSAADGFQLWSERFDREIKDIFDVQDEITQAIVDVLKVRLGGEEKSALFKRYTDDAEVYELYLKGCYHTNRHTNEDLQKAIVYFNQAIEKEPEYAPAYAGIALCLLTQWFFGTSASHEIVPQWRAMASRALEIDDSLPEAHSILGSFNFGS